MPLGRFKSKANGPNVKKEALQCSHEEQVVAGIEAVPESRDKIRRHEAVACQSFVTVSTER